MCIGPDESGGLHQWPSVWLQGSFWRAVTAAAHPAEHHLADDRTAPVHQALRPGQDRQPAARDAAGRWDWAHVRACKTVDRKIAWPSARPTNAPVEILCTSQAMWKKKTTKSIGYIFRKSVPGYIQWVKKFCGILQKFSLTLHLQYIRQGQNRQLGTWDTARCKHI